MNAPAERNPSFPDLVPFVVTCAGIIAALYYGQAILRPLALAILIAVLLNASTEKLTAIKFGVFRLKRWMGLLISISVAVAVQIVFARIVAGQADDLIAAWPRYLARLEDIAAGLSEVLGTDIAKKVGSQIGKLDLSSLASKIVGTTGSVVSQIGIVVFYIAFLLASRTGNAGKLSALFPLEQERLRISRLLNSMIESIGKYILIKTVMSFGTALVSYAIMKFMGLDFAEIWALLIFLLNYIPTIGSIVAVIFPSVIALIQFDTVVQFIFITGLLAGVQVTFGNIIEPVLTGRTLNLSSLVVLFALALWGSLWGIVGMFLSVPSTVILMIFCSHVPKLRWIAVVLSEDGRINQGDG